MYRRILHYLQRTALLCALASAGTAIAQVVPPPTRGQLLYSTHCIECHTTQMHWRTHKQARDWDSLKAQVRRWQATANLGWTEARHHRGGPSPERNYLSIPAVGRTDGLVPAR
jgi:mono/diheme cytochrome c family protein